MEWNEESRKAFLRFSGAPRKHVFFTPDGSALIRRGYINEWIKRDLQTMKRFWAEYKMGLFSES